MISLARHGVARADWQVGEKWMSALVVFNEYTTKLRVCQVRLVLAINSQHGDAEHDHMI
jgi:hypothetical protein